MAYVIVKCLENWTNWAKTTWRQNNVLYYVSSSILSHGTLDIDIQFYENRPHIQKLTPLGPHTIEITNNSNFTIHRAYSWLLSFLLSFVLKNKSWKSFQLCIISYWVPVRRRGSSWPVLMRIKWYWRLPFVELNSENSVWHKFKRNIPKIN